jgi:hypothetical protein
MAAGQLAVPDCTGLPVKARRGWAVDMDKLCTETTHSTFSLLLGKSPLPPAMAPRERPSLSPALSLYQRWQVIQCLSSHPPSCSRVSPFHVLVFLAYLFPWHHIPLGCVPYLLLCKTMKFCASDKGLLWEFLPKTSHQRHILLEDDLGFL